MASSSLSASPSPSISLPNPISSARYPHDAVSSRPPNLLLSHLPHLSSFCAFSQSSSLCTTHCCPSRPSRPFPELGSFGSKPRGKSRSRIAPFVAPSTIVTPLSDLYEFICSGPLLAKTGSSPSTVASALDEWLELGIRLSRQLGFNELRLSEEEKIRIYHYYVPVFLWCKSQLEQHRSQYEEDNVPPLVIGVSAPQGCGKTTLVYSLEYLFNSTGRQAVSVSIDDFYLTAKDQAELASQNPGNSLLELRGNAGTHDLGLGTETLKALLNLSTEGRTAKVPRYNKSANNGRGDRADPSTWPEIEGPLQVVLFEGWMLGFRPEDASVVKVVDHQLEVVNRNLEAYYEAWDRYIDSWIIIQVKESNWVYKWRLGAEIAMKLAGLPGMTDEEVADFVSRYMPAYKAYLPGLYSSGPKGSKPEGTLQFDINVDRNPIG